MYVIALIGMLAGCSQIPDRQPPRLLDFRLLPATEVDPPQYVLCAVDGGPWGCKRKSDIAVDDISARGFSDPLPSITFAFDSDEVEFSEISALSEWIGHLESNQINSIRLYGYADEVGEPAYNLNLSMRRIDAVENVLRKKGYKGMITKKAMGSCCFLTGGNAEGINERINRRVEIKFD